MSGSHQYFSVEQLCQPLNTLISSLDKIVLPSKLIKQYPAAKVLVQELVGMINEGINNNSTVEGVPSATQQVLNSLEYELVQEGLQFRLSLAEHEKEEVALRQKIDNLTQIIDSISLANVEKIIADYNMIAVLTTEAKAYPRPSSCPRLFSSQSPEEKHAESLTTQLNDLKSSKPNKKCAATKQYLQKVLKRLQQNKQVLQETQPQVSASSSQQNLQLMRASVAHKQDELSYAFVQRVVMLCIRVYKQVELLQAGFDSTVASAFEEFAEARMETFKRVYIPETGGLTLLDVYNHFLALPGEDYDKLLAGNAAQNLTDQLIPFVSKPKFAFQM